jgi:hypothetical protein
MMKNKIRERSSILSERARSATFFYGVETLWRAMDRRERSKIRSTPVIFDKKISCRRLLLLCIIVHADSRYTTRDPSTLLYYLSQHLAQVVVIAVVVYTMTTNENVSNDDVSLLEILTTWWRCESFSHETDYYARRHWEEENDSEDGWLVSNWHVL